MISTSGAGPAATTFLGPQTMITCWSAPLVGQMNPAHIAESLALTQSSYADASMLLGRRDASLVPRTAT